MKISTCVLAAASWLIQSPDVFALGPARDGAGPSPVAVTANDHATAEQKDNTAAIREYESAHGLENQLAGELRNIEVIYDEAASIKTDISSLNSTLSAVGQAADKRREVLAGIPGHMAAISERRNLAMSAISAYRSAAAGALKAIAANKTAEKDQ